MKVHITLQALSSLQAQTRNLRAYVQIISMERRKLGMLRIYSPMMHGTWESESITKVYPSESGGMSFEVSVMEMEQ